MNGGLQELAQRIKRSNRVVVLTGAGISVPSGIPDFRSPGGIWTRYDPFEYATLDAFLAAPEKVWKFLDELQEMVVGAKPNPAHFALAEMEKLGHVRGVITQNVDGLHQEAGSREVVEFHGNGRVLHCLGCGAEYPASFRQAGGPAPRCACGAVLKPKIVFFGEGIPPEANERAVFWARGAEVLLVVGTSAEVMPASLLPGIARHAGAHVAEFNLARTQLSGYVVHDSVFGPCEETLPALVAELRQNQSPADGRAWPP